MPSSRSAVALNYPRTIIGEAVTAARPPATDQAAATESSSSEQRNLAFIDVGRRKLPFLLALQRHLPQEVRCLYFTRREPLRSLVEGARAPLYPRGPLSTREYAIGEETLRAALGAKLLTLRGPESMKIARRVLQELAEFFATEQVDAIFVWNGANKLTSALAVHLAREKGIAVMFAEHGYLPGTMQIDPLGVNQQASVTPLVEKGEARLGPDPRIDAALDRLIDCHRQGRPPDGAETRPPANLIKGLGARLYLGFTRRVLKRLKFRRPLRLSPQQFPPRLVQLPQRFVFLPFQVVQDSQLLLHSPLLGNDMRGVLRRLHEALAVVEPGARIVVKLHPREKRTAQAAYRDLPAQFPDVLFTLDHPLPDLLSRAAAVATVNSTVGFEAMLYDKPVVALGNNFYTAAGLVEKVGSLDELPAALERALSQAAVDRERRRQFLRYVYARFLVCGSYEDYSARSLSAAASRILSLLQSDRAKNRMPCPLPSISG